MIPANELRINNLWQHKETKSIMKIDAAIQIVDASILGEPIPLTEELMLKCGGEIEGDGYNSIIIRITENSGFVLYSSGHIVYTISHAPIVEFEHIKYLHQFQNLFKDFTNQELTIKL